MKSEFNGNLSFEIFGASHESEIGITVSGLPKGFLIDTKKLDAFLSRRSPAGKDYASGRKEADIPEFKSGIKNGMLDGKPLTAVIKNTDVKRKDYDELKNKPRPSHADYTAFIKYGKDFDASGGGHFSGRMTAPLCILGGICIQILEQKGINIISRISEIGGIKDEGELELSTAEKPFPTVNDACGKRMLDAVNSAKAEGDSLGGVIECKITGVSAGFGGALFDGLESSISRLIFAVPAVKGIEFGSGFDGSRLKGSENNDCFTAENGKITTKTNNCGGILGGISNGMPISFKVAVKPTPSIAKPQETVDLRSLTNCVISINGRHDPCIVPRAVPCVEAAAAIAMLDVIMNESGTELQGLREEIDRIDRDILRLFEKRMNASLKIADYKIKNKSPIYDEKREEEKLSSVEDKLPAELKADGRELYSLIMRQSREHQQKKISKSGKYGLLGKGLSHSFSPFVHKLLGCSDYRLFDTDDLEGFMKSKDFDGINVTSPYKKAVIPYLDFLSDTAKETGSVNTVIKDANGKLTGYNTDVTGFLLALKKNGISPRNKKILVLGSGGASASAICALKRLGASDITVISRNGKDNYANIEKHKNARIIVNATPVGMYPQNGEAPLSLDVFTNLCAVADLIYNPAKTKLLLDAEQMGIKTLNGLCMLTEQARASEELFFGNKISAELGEKAEKELRFLRKNIVLIGMPGSGKTTTARELSRLLGRKAVDSDAEIEKRYKKSPKEIISESGEERFREIETEVLRDICKESGTVISCGGGVVERKENLPLIRQNSVVVYLKRRNCFLKKENRPISQKEGLCNLLLRREPLYNEFADVTVTAVNGVEENAKRILEAIK